MSDAATLYFYDGSSSGRIKCVIDNWNGVVYKIPRCKVQDAQSTYDMTRSGIYFLIQPCHENENILYVGQGVRRTDGTGVLRRTLETHRAGDSWQDALIVVSTDNSLMETEINYLENRFYSIASIEGEYNVCNANTPPSCAANEEIVPEEVVIRMNSFIEKVKVALSLLGYSDIFKKEQVSTANSSCVDAVFHINQQNVQARGIYDFQTNFFTVFKHSLLQPNISASCSQSIRNDRERYAEKIDNENRLTEEILFTSPSAAVSFLYGSSQDGTKCWKNDEGAELGTVKEEWQILHTTDS